MEMSSPAKLLALATCITLGSACTPPLASPPLAEPHHPAGQATTAPAVDVEGTKEPTPSTPCKEPADLTKLPGDPVTGEWVTTPSCLKYTVLRPGNGSQPKSRLSTVRAHYTGWLTDGTQFDSSVARGKPFDFRLSQVSLAGPKHFLE